MLGEVTHLQTISEDLKSLTMDPHKLPSSSEQVGVLATHSGEQTEEVRVKVARVPRGMILCRITAATHTVVHT